MRLPAAAIAFYERLFFAVQRHRIGNRERIDKRIANMQAMAQPRALGSKQCLGGTQLRGTRAVRPMIGRRNGLVCRAEKVNACFGLSAARPACHGERVYLRSKLEG